MRDALGLAHYKDPRGPPTKPHSRVHGPDLEVPRPGVAASHISGMDTAGFPHDACISAGRNGVSEKEDGCESKFDLGDEEGSACRGRSWFRPALSQRRRVHFPSTAPCSERSVSSALRMSRRRSRTLIHSPLVVFAIHSLHSV